MQLSGILINDQILLCTSKTKQQEDYQAKLDSMPKHSVGGLYDVRTIIKFSGATERPSF